MRRTFLAITAVLAPAVTFAQVQQSASAALTQDHVYSLYVTRHAATVKFAELGVAKATNGDVKKLAEKLVKEERDVGERLQKEAAKSSIKITPIGHDTTDAMLANATAALSGKSGIAFDSVWTNRAYAWLSTLVLDNNINVSHKLPDGDLKKFAQAYSTFHFRLAAETSSLQKKLR